MFKWKQKVAVLITFCLLLMLVPQMARAEQIDQVFIKDEVGEVRITLDEDDFQEIIDHPTDEEYTNADVDYNGETVTNIGFRTKGNSSLTSVASSDSDRYSFKLKLDKYIDGQNLSGYTKINLNNNFQDPTYMREYLAYEALSEMGVPTPNYSFVNLYINDELYGLYLAVEQVDEEAYLDRYFNETTGSIYKPDGTGSDLVWLGEDIDLYTGLNAKSEQTDSEAMLAFLNEINSGGENIETYLDVDSFLRYLAVNTVISNLDSYQGNFAHNYYLYEQDGFFSVLPWDFNMAFAGFGASEEAQVELLIDEPTMGALADRPLIAVLLEQDEYRELYHSYVEEAISGMLGAGEFSERIETLEELIGEYVEADPTSFYTYEQHVDSLTNTVENVPGLAIFMEKRVENVSQQLSGDIPSSGDGEGLGEEAGPGGGQGMMGGAPPDMNENTKGNMVPPDQTERDQILDETDDPFGGEQPPNQAGGEIPEMRAGQAPNGDRGGQSSAIAGSTNVRKEAMIVGGAVVLLLLIVLFVHRFKRNAY